MIFVGAACLLGNIPKQTSSAMGWAPRENDCPDAAMAVAGLPFQPSSYLPRRFRP
jgi:hypothetical protein